MKTRALILALMCLAASFASCGEEKNPNATLGGVKSLLVDGGNPSWSPDGELIVYVSAGNLYSIPWQGGDPTQVTSMSGLEIDPDFLPEAGQRKIVFANKPSSGENGIYLLDLGGGEPQLVHSTSASPQHCCFSADGEWILFSTQTVKGIQRIPVAGGEPEVIPNSIDWETMLFLQTARSNDSVLYIESRKVGSLSAQNLYRLQIDGGAPTVLTELTGSEYPNHFLTAVAESFDGGRLAFVTSRGDGYWRQTLWVIPAVDPGTDYVQITDIDDGTPGFPSWSPDGTRIAVALDGALYVIKLFD